MKVGCLEVFKQSGVLALMLRLASSSFSYQQACYCPLTLVFPPLSSPFSCPNVNALSHCHHWLESALDTRGETVLALRKRQQANRQIQTAYSLCTSREVGLGKCWWRQSGDSESSPASPTSENNPLTLTHNKMQTYEWQGWKCYLSSGVFLN